MAVDLAHLAVGTTLIRALLVSTVVVTSGPTAAQFLPGLEYTNQPALAAINVIPAYNAGLSGQGMRVGVVDTGLNPNHVEFKGALIAGYDALTGIAGTSNFSSFLVDYDFHGSHVASTAVARLDGVARPGNMQGVAYQAGLVMSALNFTPTLTEQQIAAAIDYVSSQGVKVINNSWGSDSAGKGDPRAWYELNLPDNREIIRAIHTALDRGSVIVFAAANESKVDNVAVNPSVQSTFPLYDAAMAAKGGFIVVAATTNDGSALTSYSNRCGVAWKYCISAPGGGGQYPLPEGKKFRDEFILGAYAQSDNEYVWMAGTSMASPIVSGAVALVAEQFPWMTNKNLATTLLTTASRAEHPDHEWGRGLLNVGKAILGPGIFEEDFSANVTAGYAATFSNDISGTAGLIKLGAGSLALTGNNRYTGNTYLNGGTLVAYQQGNLGNTASALLFDGGTLKFGAPFTLTRDIWLGPQGGSLDLNGFNHTQGSQISGDGRLGVTGGGSLTLDRANTQRGGLAVQGGSQVNAQGDSYLGLAGSGVRLDQGRLNLLNGFVAAAPGIFDRPLEIGPGHGTIDTGNNRLVYTGGAISGGGMLSFLGTPFALGSDLTLNGIWNSTLEVPASLTLKGNGGVNGDLRVLGTLSPGNSPGVLTVSGSVSNAPGSTFNVDIDGPGTGIGAGSHDRLVLTGAGSTYTAGGTLNLLLRGITGPANNSYQPELGQGFQFVTAPGGILGSYASLNQPAAGLLPGTRMDLIFAGSALSAYVTPASYAQLDTLGIDNNRNRQQIGSILEKIRPGAGQRAADAESQAIFAGLAPQSRHSLPQSLDQLAGVSYVQLLAVNRENTRYITEQALMVAGRQRRNETLSAMPAPSSQAPDDSEEQMWVMALGRSARWGDDRNGAGINDDLSGLMSGVSKRINAETQAGFALAYGASATNIREHLGNGQMQNLQLMGYASHQQEDGFFLRGVAGFGAGNIEAKRNVPMLAQQYDANIITTNLSLAAQGGWTVGPRDAIHYETLFGLNYLVQRNAGFKDHTRGNVAELRAEATTQQALVLTAASSANLSFEAKDIDWHFSARAGLSQDLLKSRAELDAQLRGQSYQLESSALGRTRLQLGLGLSGRIAKHTQLGLDLGYQTARDWSSLGASVSVQIRF